MPGNANCPKRYLLDTNALVALLQGHADLLTRVESADWLGVSVINVLEFLGFDGLSEIDRQLFNELLQRIVVVDLTSGNAALMALIIEIRQSKALKLPDAIVMACAAIHEATVLTHDVQLLKLAASDDRFSAVPF
jgi:predicted nucleic acid-binding protein